MAVGILLADAEGAGSNPGGSVKNAVGNLNPLPIGKDYLTQIDYVGGTNAIYVGHAMPATLTSAASWRIKKIAYDGNNNPTSVKWAGGVKTFSQVWDNRASLSYS